MNRLVESLAEVCRSNLLQEKWLIAPSLRAGRQWLDCVTRFGQPVANVRVNTIKGMALDLAGPEMARKSLNLVSSKGSEIIVDLVLNRIREESPIYLTNLPVTQALARSVYSSINDLRMAGIDEAALKIDSFEVANKGEEIRSIVREYLETLSNMDLIDYATAIDMAVDALSSDPNFFHDDVSVLVPEDLDLAKKERALLRAIPAGTFVMLPVDRPSVLASSRASSRTNVDLLGWILEPVSAPVPVPGDETVRIFRAVGEINEVREVFRRSLWRGLPLDEVEILHTDAETYVPLIYETAARLKPEFSGPGDLMVTFEEGIPASYSRPGKALAAWVSWIRHNYLQTDLMGMLQEGLVRIPASAPAHCSNATLAEVLGSVNIGFGPDRYLMRLDETIRALELQLAGPKVDLEEDEPSRDDALARLNQRSQTAECLREVVREVLDCVAGPEAGAQECLSGAVAFLEKIARSADELDNYSLKALINEIRATLNYLARSGGLVSLHAWDWLAELPGQVRVMGSGPRPGRMHVAGIHRGGHSLRKQTFVIGMDDGRFPGAGLQDPVILDGEREQLTRELPTAASTLTRKLERFSMLLARLRGTVTLSYSCRNLLDDRETFPSQVILSAYRIISGERDGDFSRLLQWLPEPASFAPGSEDRCLDATEWWLARLCKDVSGPDAKAAMDAHFPHLARGSQACKNRNSPVFTVYDGRIPNLGDELDPTSPTGRAVSASRLEAVGRCPLMYFFKHVLELAPPVDFTVVPERWLDPLDFGTLLHEIFYRFVSGMMQTRWPPGFPDDLHNIQAIVRSLAENQRSLIPPPTEEAYLRQVRQLLDAAAVFLRSEADALDRQPVYLEASVGIPAFQEGTGLDSSAPVSIGLPNGKRIRIRGRLDRIDRLRGSGSPEYVVCDYKSGSSSRYGAPDPFKQGRTVQHAVYLAIADAMLKKEVSREANVAEFAYFFPGPRDHGLRLQYRPLELSAWGTIVQNLCEIAATGSFLATDDYETDCRYCNYLAICGDVAAVSAASRAKLENLDNLTLRPMRELRNRG